MFASIRRYRLHRGSMHELARRVDEGFAEDIGRQPGFVAYEFVDCGDGEIITLSVFRNADQAETSRELARRWTEENLQDLEFSRGEALRGEILVSRAARDMLEPGHVGAARKFASVRRYRLRTGSIAELMHIIDEIFADPDRGHGRVRGLSRARLRRRRDRLDQPASRPGDRGGVR